MPTMKFGRLQSIDLGTPYQCAKAELAVDRALAIERGCGPEKFASRHVSAVKVGWTIPNQVEDRFGVFVTTRAKEPFDLFLDEKHLRRPATRAGSLGISDFRIRGYANLACQVLDNTIVYIPRASVDALAEELRVPKIDTMKHLYDKDHVDETILSLFSIIKPAIDRPAEANQYFLEHVFGAICSHVAFTYGGMQIPTVRHRGGLTPLQERRVKAQLLEHLANPPSLQELASSCSFSRSHFSQAFKQTTGLPPHQWLLAERIKRAKELLQKTRMPVNEVALESGFADQSHLTRVFSKSVGISPAVWRRQDRD